MLGQIGLSLLFRQNLIRYNRDLRRERNARRDYSYVLFCLKKVLVKHIDLIDFDQIKEIYDDVLENSPADIDRIDTPLAFVIYLACNSVSNSPSNKLLSEFLALLKEKNIKIDLCSEQLSDVFRYTPLEYLVRQRDKAGIQLLINNYKKVSETGKLDLDQGLRSACSNGNGEIIKILIEAGAKLKRDMVVDYLEISGRELILTELKGLAEHHPKYKKYKKLLNS